MSVFRKSGISRCTINDGIHIIRIHSLLFFFIKKRSANQQLLDPTNVPTRTLHNNYPRNHDFTLLKGRRRSPRLLSRLAAPSRERMSASRIFLLAVPAPLVGLALAVQGTAWVVAGCLGAGMTTAVPWAGTSCPGATAEAATTSLQVSAEVLFHEATERDAIRGE